MSLNKKEKKLQFVNAIVGIHDFNCNCKNPAFHSAKILLEQLAPELTPQDKINLQKCLGEDTAGEDGPIDDFGDLEDIFADDTTEDTG